ncbi:iron-sulfur cluster biosynthesis family protein [Alkalihalobacillus sp. FSL W8-0930]
MDITVTDAAASSFQSIQSDKAIRVVARDTFECSTMIEFYLQLDDPVESEDTTVRQAGQQFIYNKKASDEIGSRVTIDYKPTQGLKMVNPNQTLAYGLTLK